VLRISLGVTALYIALLVVAGIRAHSLALLSEAGHNLSDFLALLLSLAAVYLEGRPPSVTKTYGYRRAGVLAALVNSLSLVVVSFFIFYEAARRIQHPEHVHAGLMIWVAAAGVAMNGAIALLLWRSGRDAHPSKPKPGLLGTPALPSLRDWPIQIAVPTTFVVGYSLSSLRDCGGLGRPKRSGLSIDCAAQGGNS